MGPVLSVREAAGGQELLSQLCHKTHKNSANHNFSFHCQKTAVRNEVTAGVCQRT